MATTLTLTLVEPTAADGKAAAAIIVDTPTSNRGTSTAERAATLLTAAVRTMRLAGGQAVEVSAVMPVVSDGAPCYNILHRAIGTAPFRTGKVGKRVIWTGVKPVYLINCQQTGNVVTGITSSTARSGGRYFLIPAE